MNEPANLVDAPDLGRTQRELRHRPFIAPTNTRPYQSPSEPNEARVTFTPARRQIWRQVGWHGHTGAFYNLEEDPSRHEPAGFSPLWVLVDDDAADVVVIRAHNAPVQP